MQQFILVHIYNIIFSILMNKSGYLVESIGAIPISIQTISIVIYIIHTCTCSVLHWPYL